MPLPPQLIFLVYKPDTMLYFKQLLSLFFLLLGTTCISKAQYFSTTIDVDNSSDTGFQLYWTGTEFVIFSASLCLLAEGETSSCPTLIRVSSGGNVLDYQITGEYFVPNFSAFVRHDDGRITVLLQPSPAQDSNIVIREYAPDLSFIKEQKYGQDLEGERPFFMVPYNGGFAISNSIQNLNGERAMWIQYLNADLQQVNETFFPELSGGYGLVAQDDLIATSDGYLVGTEDNGSLLSLTGLVTKFDSLGQVVWQTVFPPEDQQINSWTDIQVAELGNGIIAANWQKNMEPEVPEYTPAMLTINGLSSETGEVVWSYPFIRQRFALSFVHNLMAAENGDLIGMGRIDELPEPNPLPKPDWLLHIGWIFRMSADGELKWQRYIYDDRSPLYYPSYFNNATELPNGDLAFVGVYEDTFPNQDPYINDPNVWLVRTDSNGCLTPNCGDLQIVTDTGIITSTWEEFLSVRKDMPFRVFPNPAAEAWNVEWPHGTNAQLILYNMQGQALRQEELQPGTNRISTLNLPPGLYVMQVRSREGWGSRKVVRR